MASKSIKSDQASGTVEQLPDRVVYRDNAFISRTLVMHGGRTLPVSAHRVEASDAEARAFLDAHPDLERLPE